MDPKEKIMAKRNDPEQLEAEAKELMQKMMKVEEGTPEADQPPEDTPEELEATEQEAPEPTDTAETTAEQDTADESVSGDDYELKLAKAEKAMKGAQARMTKATQEAAELRKANEQMLQSIAELKSQLAESQRDDSKLNQIREDYPDLAGPLLDEQRRTQEEVLSLKEKLKEAEQQKIRDAEDKAAAEHFDRIRAVHPDVDELIETADWLNWVEESDAQTKQWIQSGSSNDVNSVLTRFKEDLNIKPSTPQEKTLERAKQVAEPKLPKARKSNLKGEKKHWTVDEIVRMPNHLFEKHQDEILKAMNSGGIRR